MLMRSAVREHILYVSPSTPTPSADRADGFTPRSETLGLLGLRIQWTRDRSLVQNEASVPPLRTTG